jgi:hypothetical protein
MKMKISVREARSIVLSPDIFFTNSTASDQLDQDKCLLAAPTPEHP